MFEFDDKLKLLPNLGNGDTVNGEPIATFIDKELGKEINLHRHEEIKEMKGIKYRPVQNGVLQKKAGRTKPGFVYNSEQKRRYTVEKLGQGSPIELVIGYFKNLSGISNLLSIKEIKYMIKEKHSDLDEGKINYAVGLIAKNRNLDIYFENEYRRTALYLRPKHTFYEATYEELTKEFTPSHYKTAKTEPETQENNNQVTMETFVEYLKKQGVKEFTIKF